MCGKMQESRLTEIIPLMCTSALWGQYPVLSHPESPQGVCRGETAVADGLLEGYPVSFFFLFGLCLVTCRISVPQPGIEPGPCQ